MALYPYGLVGHSHVKLLGLAFLLKLCFVFFSPPFTLLVSTLFKVPILFNVFDSDNKKEKEKKNHLYKLEKYYW